MGKEAEAAWRSIERRKLSLPLLTIVVSMCMGYRKEGKTKGKKRRSTCRIGCAGGIQSSNHRGISGVQGSNAEDTSPRC